MLSFDELAEAIDQVVVELHRFPTRTTDYPIGVDEATAKAGYKKIGERWRPVESGSMLQRLANHIGHDLAYSSDQLTGKNRCQELAAALLEHADSSARWYTNYSSSDTGAGWEPITSWTFEAAYVALGDTTTLVICFLAED